MKAQKSSVCRCTLGEAASASSLATVDFPAPGGPESTMTGPFWSTSLLPPVPADAVEMCQFRPAGGLLAVSAGQVPSSDAVTIAKLAAGLGAPAPGPAGK